MTGPEMKERRLALGWSASDLGERLREHTDQIDRWEQVTGQLPAAISRRADWALAFEAQQQALVKAGHPPCPTGEAYFDHIPLDDPKALERALAQANDHAKSCALCQAREAFIATLPPLPPPPVSPTVKVLMALTDRIGRYPAWIRPAAWAALVLGGMTLIRAVLLLTLGGGKLSLPIGLQILGAVGVGAYGGVVGGLTFALVRPRTRHLGRPGDYLTGLACAYAFVGAFGVPLALFASDPGFRNPIVIGSCFVVATVLGIVIGRSWFAAPN